MLVNVFESGARKWVSIDENSEIGLIIYTSDRNEAAVFDYHHLRSANEFFHDFQIYKSTMHAVPVGTNVLPTDCEIVSSALNSERQRSKDRLLGAVLGSM